MSRAAADVAAEIRARLAGSALATWPDEAMVAALEALATRDARAEHLAGPSAIRPSVPGELLEEYGARRFGEHFPAAEPRLLARARSVQLARQLGLLA